MSELKECPCCGSQSVDWHYSDEDHHKVIVECGKCGTKSGSYRTVEEAIAAWNRRAQPAPGAGALIEALAQCRHHASYSVGECEALQRQLHSVRQIADAAIAAHSGKGGV